MISRFSASRAIEGGPGAQCPQKALQVGQGPVGLGRIDHFLQQQRRDALEVATGALGQMGVGRPLPQHEQAFVGAIGILEPLLFEQILHQIGIDGGIEQESDFGTHLFADLLFGGIEEIPVDRLDRLAVAFEGPLESRRIGETAAPGERLPFRLGLGQAVGLALLNHLNAMLNGA